MRIIILSALKEWIVSKFNFGAKLWQEIAESTGFGSEKFTKQDGYAALERFQSLFNQICHKLGLTYTDFQNQFLQFWLTDFAPRLFQVMTQQVKNARDYIINLNKLNNELVGFFPQNKMLSKVNLKEPDSTTIVLSYSSEKSLVDIIGILRGVSHFFKDAFAIKKTGSTTLEIKFQK